MTATHRVTVSDDEIDAAVARGRVAARNLPIAEHATYDPTDDTIVVRFKSGVTLRVPRHLLQGLEDATPEDLAAIELVGPGTGLHWPQLDVDHYLPGLAQSIFGTREWMAELGRRGGSVTSQAKAAAARRNGRRGGRPSANTAGTTGPDPGDAGRKVEG